MSEETSTQPTKHNSGNLPQEACYEKQLSLFLIGLEMLGEKKKRFISYLLSLQKPHTESQEEKADEL
jgi:hypothetical protein